MVVKHNYHNILKHFLPETDEKEKNDDTLPKLVLAFLHDLLHRKPRSNDINKIEDDAPVGESDGCNEPSTKQPIEECSDKTCEDSANEDEVGTKVPETEDISGKGERSLISALLRALKNGLRTNRNVLTENENEPILEPPEKIGQSESCLAGGEESKPSYPDFLSRQTSFKGPEERPLSIDKIDHFGLYNDAITDVEAKLDSERCGSYEKHAQITINNSNQHSTNQCVNEIKQEESLENAFQQFEKKGWRKKKEVTIGQNGGVIEVGGCMVDIPEGALEKETTIEVEVGSKISGEDLNDPPKGILIAPTLKCSPPTVFQKNITVSLRSFIRTTAGEIEGNVMYKGENDSKWQRIGSVFIGSGEFLRFQVNHFCPFITTLDPDKIPEDGTIIPVCCEVYMLRTGMKRGSYTVSIFKNKVSCREFSEALPDHYVRAMAGPEEMSVEMGEEIHAELQYDDRSANAKQQDKTLMADKDFACQQRSTIYFNTLSFDESGDASATLKIKMGGKVREIPLSAPFHMGARPSVGNQQITAKTIAMPGGHINLTESGGINNMEMSMAEKTKNLKQERQD